MLPSLADEELLGRGFARGRIREAKKHRPTRWQLWQDECDGLRTLGRWNGLAVQFNALEGKYREQGSRPGEINGQRGGPQRWIRVEVCDSQLRFSASDDCPGHEKPSGEQAGAEDAHAPWE